ncbi:MAG TPA: hypothetical protein VGB17_14815 [Pyrinomonadaceae bacterium]|jgi:hypothetical protein
MEESKDPKSTETSAGETSAERREPESTATSSETLSDLEETEKVPATETDGGGGAGAAPSPDGAFDEAGNRGGDAGPM